MAIIISFASGSVSLMYFFTDLSCKPGYIGETCVPQCSDGQYVPGCNGNCECQNNSTCDKSDGSCDCLPGWTGVKCDKPCSVGYHGKKCKSKCLCKNNATCDHVIGNCTCDVEWRGDLCDISKY
jgi:hypothetical protein